MPHPATLRDDGAYAESNPCPEAEGVTNFDWAAVEAALDSRDPDRIQDAYIDSLAIAMRGSLQFMAGRPPRTARERRAYLRCVGERAIALIWVLNAAIIDGSNPPLELFARRFGVDRSTLYRMAKRASRIIAASNVRQRRTSRFKLHLTDT